MADQDVLLASLNSGEVSPLALARIDLAKLRVACESQSNFLPHILGPTLMRPGTQYDAEVAGDAAGWLGEFYVSETEQALLVATAAGLQFLLNDAWLTRVSVASVITNGTFAGSLTGWTNNSEAGASAAAVAGAQFIGTGSNYGWLDQQVTVAVGDQNKEHALRVVVGHGNIALLVGTSMGDGTYWNLSLKPGTYSLAFTPTGNFWVRVGGNDAFPDYLTSITIEAAGAVSLPVPWAAADLDLIRYDQSADVMFVAAGSTSNSIGYQQQRIERRAADSRSWGIATYLADDGPFRPANTGATTITPSDVHGSINLTASRAIFQSGHVGALFTLTQSGQSATATLAGANQQTGTIRVSGLHTTTTGGSQRIFAISISGTFSATVVLQRSLGAIGSWTDVESWTAPVSTTYDDGLDNQIVYYRLAIESAYTSGSAVCQLTYSGSSQTGVCRITTVTNAETATADVLAQLGTASQATSNWAEGEWSGYRGWPAAVSLHEGRLTWGTSVSFDGSVSDAFSSFDPTVTGDSGPLDFTVATGGLDGIRWLLSLQRLIAATSAQEISIRASSLDEPLTPTAFVERVCSTRGAAKVRPLRVDQQGVFVGRNGQRVYELSWNAQQAYFDYASRELTRLHQEVAAAGIVDCAVQRQPDTRLWFVLADGTCAVLTYDHDDDVEAWTPVTTPNGFFERVASLPGSDEDAVYFIVRRVVGGVTKRFIEKLAKRDEAQGGATSKAGIDCHTFAAGPTASVSTPQFADGTSVVVWANGVPLFTVASPVTVSGGAVALGGSYSNVTVGLAVTAQIQTGKLGYAAEHGTPLEQQKRVARVGLIMRNVCPAGIKIGRDFSHLQSLPATYRGKALTAGQVLTDYDAVPGPFNSGWDSDARACIQVQGPYPATIMALALYMKTNEPADAPVPKGRG